VHKIKKPPGGEKNSPGTFVSALQETPSHDFLQRVRG